MENGRKNEYIGMKYDCVMREKKEPLGKDSFCRVNGEKEGGNP